MSEQIRHGTYSESSHDSRAASRKSLWIALALISSYMVAEIIGGLIANSLALLADAGHMVTDATAIGLALLAMWVAARPASARRSFGFHRTETLAALLNALSLWVIAAWISVEAIRRIMAPSEVQGMLMLSVGFVGLLVNFAAAWVLKRSVGQSLNVEGAFLHVLGDLLGSVGVVAAGLLVLAFGWNVADPIFGIIIGVLILFSSSRLLWKVLHVLMEGTPSGLNLQQLCNRIESEEGVTGVHDIHAWSITTGYEVLSAHVTADMAKVSQPDHLLQHLREVASREFGIAHVTIQLEDSLESCEEAHHVAHDEERSLHSASRQSDH
ncbi:MAG: cation diffusion facilitator family transporter [Dehalococcoidia bacterium]